MKKMIYTVSKKFRVRGATKNRVVPHITMYGPFKTNKQREMVKRVKKVCSKYDIVGFKIDGFGKFRKDVVFVKIKPSKHLEELRKELMKELASITVTSDFDFQEYKFHSTLAFRDIGRKFDSVWKFINKQKPPKKKQVLLRLTILKGKKILYEYDFMQKRLLNRSQSLNKGFRKKTMRIFKEKLNQ